MVADRWANGRTARRAMWVCPFLLLLLFAAALLADETRALALWLLAENHPVELATFSGFLLGGVLGLRLALSLARARPAAAAFFAVFSTALLLVAMEEIAWGQWFLGFATPEAIARHNVQGELTLHNLAPLHAGRMGLTALFALGGLIGVGVRRLPFVAAVAPRPSLAPWFAAALLISGADLLSLVTLSSSRPAVLLDGLEELAELFLAAGALLYLRERAMALSAADVTSHIGSVISSARTLPAVTVTNATDTGKLKRRGPADPGLR